MTEREPSQEEVKAAACAIWDELMSRPEHPAVPLFTTPNYNIKKYLEIAREALRAAARVKEG